jgi:hypothetical protein
MDLATREKISNSSKGKPKSEEWKRKIRECYKRRKPIAPRLDRDIKEMKEEQNINSKIKHLPEMTQILIKTIWDIKRDKSLSNLERDKKILKLLNSVENIARENEIRRYMGL